MTDQRLTVEEFVGWHDGTDERHELLKGVVTALPRRSARGSLILANVACALRQRVNPPCGVLVSAGLQVSGDTCLWVDAAVTGEGLGASYWMRQPCLIVEVTLRAAPPGDLTSRLSAYQEVASIREIWAIDAEARSVRAWRLGGDGINSLPVSGGTFRSKALDDAIALDELYAGTDL